MIKSHAHTRVFNKKEEIFFGHLLTEQKGGNMSELIQYSPYIGFTYADNSGKIWHSITDLKIYRTGDGNRYNEELTSTMVDKTANVPGGDGQYYFGTTFQKKTFVVNYAFDKLTKEDIRRLKQVFSGDGIHDLVFDEDRSTDGTALKIWSAKVTGTASMKHLCFEENGKDVYKGEGSITFTCYYPFARSENKTPNEIKPPQKVQNLGDLPAPVEMTFTVTSKGGNTYPGFGITKK